MTDGIALDVHAHLVPFRSADVVGINGVAWDDARNVLIVDGHAVAMAALYRPGDLIAWMDRESVAAAWVSAPPPLYRQHLGGAAARDWSRRLTAGLDAIAATQPRRLSVLAHLPLHDPEVAAGLVEERLATGSRRFSAPVGGGDLALSDSAYDPLWGALDAVAAFVFMHPGECGDGRLKRFYLANLIGNPYETTLAIANLVFGGVLDRFPRIRFCFAHGGGAAAALAGRFGQGYVTTRPGIDHGLSDPRSLLRRICVDCITHDDDALALSCNVFGESNVVFGSDWPFPMGLLHPHEQLGGVAATRRRAIVCDNPSALARATASQELPPV